MEYERVLNLLGVAHSAVQSGVDAGSFEMGCWRLM